MQKFDWSLVIKEPQRIWFVVFTHGHKVPICESLSSKISTVDIFIFLLDDTKKFPTLKTEQVEIHFYYSFFNVWRHWKMNNSIATTKIFSLKHFEFHLKLANCETVIWLNSDIISERQLKKKEIFKIKHLTSHRFNVHFNCTKQMIE